MVDTNKESSIIKVLLIIILIALIIGLVIYLFKYESSPGKVWINDNITKITEPDKNIYKITK